jgi:hypothetical protein
MGTYYMSNNWLKPKKHLQESLPFWVKTVTTRPQAGEGEEKDEQVIPPSAGTSGMPRPNMAV